MYKTLEQIQSQIKDDRELPIANNPVLTGAVLLDAIFYPLLQHADLLIATSPATVNYDYLKDPCESLMQIAHLLKEELSLTAISRAEGTPTKNINALTEYILNTPNKKDILDAMKTQIVRSKGLHQFLDNILKALEKATTLVRASNANKFKGLFMFYAMDRNLNLIDFALHNVKLQNTTFTTLYQSYYESENRLTDIYSKYVFQVVVPKVFMTYADKTIKGFSSNPPQCFDDFTQLLDFPYIEQLQPEQFILGTILELIGIFKGFCNTKNKETADNQEGSKYDGNICFYRDTFSEREFIKDFVVKLEKLPPKETIDTFLKHLGHDELTDYEYYFAKHKNWFSLEKSYESFHRRQKFFRSIEEKMQNPFKDFKFSRIDKKIKESASFDIESICCPFRIYALSVSELFEEIKNIKKGIRNNLKEIESSGLNTGELSKKYDMMIKCINSTFFRYDKNETVKKTTPKDITKISNLMDEIISTQKLFALFPSDYVIAKEKPIHGDEKYISNVKALSITEWKQFFLRYCRADRPNLIPYCVPDSCTHEDKEKCYKIFLLSLRKIYSQMLIEDLSEEGYFKHHL